MAVDVLLIVATAVIGLLTIALSLYLLVIYQHPEDKNQAWWPKAVVLLGLCVSIWTVLLFPLDVADAQACDLDVPLSSCDFTFPMTDIWYAIYIVTIILVFAVIPFTFFYYETDADWPTSQRVSSALLWAGGFFFVVAVCVVVPYFTSGYVRYNVDGALSGMLPVNDLDGGLPGSLNSCIQPWANYNPNGAEPPEKPNSGQTTTGGGYPIGGVKCDAQLANAQEDLVSRVSFIVYCMAITATIGWVLFLVFGGIGLVALPADLIRGFINRPRAVITRSQYVDRARDLARRARDVRELGEALKREAREEGKGRRWRRNYKALQQQLVVLEEDEAQLEAVFPQGEDPEATWVTAVIMQWVALFAGVLGVVLTVCWVLQMLLYILIQPPVTPLLNTLFTDANDVFPLFGTLLFAVFVFYLQAATMKGNFKFGLNLLVFRVHPMRPGATLMSSFLFNVGLILLATTAVIQFAAAAFSLYANGTAILDIFGNQLTNIDGLKYIYTKGIFIYMFLGVMILTLLAVFLKDSKAWRAEMNKRAGRFGRRGAEVR